MLICYNEDETWKRPYDCAQSAPVDAAIVATRMMLSAHNEGIGMCWVMHFNPFSMRESFEIPENIEPVALLVMGYPAEDVVPNERHSTKRPMSENVFYNSFK